MSKIATLAALALIAVVPAAAHANEHEAKADAAVAATAVAPAVEAKEVTCKDGMKLVIEGEMVSSVAADGTKTPAVDGKHELADGTVLEVKEGKLVVAPKEEVKAEEVKEEVKH